MIGSIIRPATQTDAEAIAAIYNHYIIDTTATFEETPVSTDDMATRVTHVLNSNLPWVVMESDGEILGYAYATQWKTRSAYRFTVEATIYLSPDAPQASGLGTKLYTSLLDALKQREVHVILGVITLPNPASVALHEKLGMKKVAHFSEVGFKKNRWLDVGYWSVVLGRDKVNL